MKFKMPPAAYPAGLKLKVRELDRALTFYTGMLGLDQQSDGQGSGSEHIRLGLKGRRFYLDLQEDLQAPLRPYPSVGLYHFALLLPDRRSLACIFSKLVKAGWDFEGAADHGVSEALYLRDPERNGIELYRDRPRESWRVEDGRVAMVTDPLDLYALLEEAPEPAPLDPVTRLGHMHLHVDDLERAARFYSDALGLETRATLPGAQFLAAGDYHHHLGLNTWAGNRRAPAEATGLIQYTWRLPAGTLDELSRQLENYDAGLPDGESLRATDPIGVDVRFVEDE